jgi:hypothetical protein
VVDSAINERPKVDVQRISYSVRGPEWGFAVPQGDLDALSEVMAICSHYWNGIGALIIPVNKHGRTPPYLERMLEVREVEEVFLHEGLGEQARAAMEQRFHCCQIYDGMLDGEIHPLFLSLNDRPEELRKICRPLMKGKRLARIALALWGQIEDEDLEDWRERYAVSEAAGPKALTELLAGQINGRTPLQLGARHMELIEQVHGVDRYPQLFVFGRGTFYELSLFWNLRSRFATMLGTTRIVGIPRELASAEGVEPLLGWLEKIRHGGYLKPDLSLAAGKAELSSLRSALRAHGFRRAPRDRRWLHGFPNPPKGREQLEHREAIAPIGGPLKRGANANAIVTFTEQRAVMTLASPKGVRLPWGYVRLSMRGLPTALPMNSVSAQKLIPNAESIQDGMRVKTISGQGTWSWDLTLPSASESLEQWASSFGYAVQPSQPGRFGQALLTRLRRPEALDALASELALSILSELAPRSTKRLAQRIAGEIEQRSLAEATVNEELLAQLLREQGLSLEIEAKTLHAMASTIGVDRAALLDPLEGLVEAGLVRRATQLHCERCNFSHTYLLAEADEWVRCRACGERLANPVALDGEEYPRSYLLDGLAAQLVEHGMVPVILALRQAQIKSPGGAPFFAWPGLLFRKGEEGPTDADLLISNGETVRIVECKSKAEWLEEGQVKKLLRLCEQLGARPAIAAAEGNFASDVTEAIVEAGGDVMLRADLLA